MGKTLAMRDAAPADAEFILGLRIDARKSRYLSAVSGRLPDQQAWLERYQHGSGEAYFVIESLAGHPLGTVRLYDAQGPSFCWGSWILVDGCPSGAAVESALMVYAYALDTLGFTAAHFQVQRGNESVRAFHERFGAVLNETDEHEYRFTLSLEAIRASMRRYARFLPGPLMVEGLQ
ncbi:GNAT family N-acetyltransferase [Azohydromonas australica]|uniref:GNAT family N-acetyltransferase n=1 Tax=Azohydromonas australica TaxID=364039 RepID=UPI001469D426|nr:GNAT family N-acetyltransferase [Azohydromonas australica]